LYVTRTKWGLAQKCEGDFGVTRRYSNVNMKVSRGSFHVVRFDSYVYSLGPTWGGHLFCDSNIFAILNDCRE
jgi:hypothetical protein